MIVTRQTHPAVFAAFLEIDYDNGAVNRLEPARVKIAVPEPWSSTLAVAQKALEKLTQEELVTFCCGEETEMSALASSRNIPPEVGKLLNAYFNDWIVGGGDGD